MEKVVLKAAVKAVLAILIIFVLVFAVFNLAFPQHMATFTENMGYYSLAVKYADLRYSYTKNYDDLVRCFEDGVLAKNDSYVIKYGESVIENKDKFEELCEKKQNADSAYLYRDWAYSKVSVSYYNEGKKDSNKDNGEKKVVKAFELAIEGNGLDEFRYGNALMSLAASISAARDGNTALLMFRVLDEGFMLPDGQKITPTEQRQIDDFELVKTKMRSTVENSSAVIYDSAYELTL